MGNRFTVDPETRRQYRELYHKYVYQDRDIAAVRKMADEMGVTTQAVYDMFKRLGLKSPSKILGRQKKVANK